MRKNPESCRRKQCLLVLTVFLFVLASSAFPYSDVKAERTSSTLRELEVLRYAQETYDSITEEFTAESYQRKISHDRAGYTNKLNNAKQFKAVYDFHQDIASSLMDIELGLLMQSPKKIAEAAGRAGLDTLMEDVLDIRIDMSMEDFVFSQAVSAARSVAMQDILDTMKRAEENGGQFASYQDAELFLKRYLENRMQFATLSMAASCYEYMMNRSSMEAISDMFVRVALSELGGKLGKDYFLNAYLSGKISTAMYDILDTIGQQVHKPFMTEWISTQKSLMSEIERYFSTDAEGLDFEGYDAPPAFPDYLGTWVCDPVDDSRMVLEQNKGCPGVRILFPSLDREDKAVFAGVDLLGRNVFLNAEGAYVLFLTLMEDEIFVEADVYGTKGFGSFSGNPAEIMFRRAENNPEPGASYRGNRLTLEEKQDLFFRLSKTELMASSGVGAWGAEMTIDSTGRFSGYYADADAEEVYEVSFSGILEDVCRESDTVYTMTAKEVSTLQPPGTKEEGESGEFIVYMDSPFPEGCRLLLTLPGTPDEQIPEMVRGEIGGTFWEWDDYSIYTTLTRAEDGWGFFTYDDDEGGEETPEPIASASPVPPSVQPSPTEVPASDAEWAGLWATRDDSLSELVITGDGTLHADAFFLRTMHLGASLTPMTGHSLKFESDYGLLSGILSMAGDGTLTLTMTGGSTYEDEEATEYQAYFSRTFVYYPAAYEDMWYEAPSDQGGSGDDWLGEWIVQREGRTASMLRIERSDNGFSMDVLFDNGCSFSGELEESEDGTMDFYCDDFNCMLTLNRKLGRILMEEIGSTDNRIYDWLEKFYYGVVEYTRASPPEKTEAVPTATPEPKQEIRIPVMLTLMPSDPEENPTEKPEEPPVGGDPGYFEVPVSSVNATSYIVGKDPSAYAPWRMTDGEETTAFQFSTKTTALGEMRLHFYFSSPAALDELWMKNGFWKTTDGYDQYIRNCRVKKMTIYVCYWGSDTFHKLKTVTLEDDGRQNGWKVIDMQGVTDVKCVRLRIDDVYRGSKYKNDVCISEVMFVKNGGPR